IREKEARSGDETIPGEDEIAVLSGGVIDVHHRSSLGVSIEPDQLVVLGLVRAFVDVFDALLQLRRSGLDPHEMQLSRLLPDPHRTYERVATKRRRDRGASASLVEFKADATAHKRNR